MRMARGIGLIVALSLAVPLTACGSDTLEVPDVTGMRLDDAQEAMRAAGFEEMESVDVVTDSVPFRDHTWAVIEQKPRAGESVEADTKLTLGAGPLDKKATKERLAPDSPAMALILKAEAKKAAEKKAAAEAKKAREAKSAAQAERKKQEKAAEAAKEKAEQARRAEEERKSAKQAFEASLRTVSYEVTGSARAVDVTYSDANGSVAQQSQIRLPIPASKLNFRTLPGEFVQIMAQNATDSGTVTCTIRVNGRVVDTATSSGGFVIAGCQAVVPD